MKRISLEVTGTEWEKVGISDFQEFEDLQSLAENKMH